MVHPCDTIARMEVAVQIDRKIPIFIKATTSLTYLRDKVHTAHTLLNKLHDRRWARDL